jgi:hypothetical protein
MISILALKLQNYETTFNLANLVEKRDLFIRAPDQKLTRGVILSYIGCIVHNERTNFEKAKKVQCATYLLFSSIALVGIAIGILLSLYQDKADGPILTILQGGSLQENTPFLPNPLKVMKGDYCSIR